MLAPAADFDANDKLKNRGVIKFKFLLSYPTGTLDYFLNQPMPV